MVAFNKRHFARTKVSASITKVDHIDASLSNHENSSRERVDRLKHSQPLRNALATGEPLDDPEAVEYVMALAAQDASLWGAPGRAAYERVERSLRNLALKLDRDQVRRFVDRLIELGDEHAPVALKAALVAQYGPAAAIALEGVDLVVEQQPAQSSSARSPVAQLSSDETPDNDESRTPRARRIRVPYLERLRTMSLAFR